MAGVSLRRLEQVVLLAALGAVQAAHAAALGGKLYPYQLAVFMLAGDIDLCGDIRRLVVIALDEALYELFFRDVEALVQNELAGALRAALADYKDAGPGDGLLAVEADDIDIHAGWEHHLLAIVQPVDYLEAALTRPARSKSSSAAAADISSLRSAMRSRRLPDKKRSTRRTFLA